MPPARQDWGPNPNSGMCPGQGSHSQPLGYPRAHHPSEPPGPGVRPHPSQTGLAQSKTGGTDLLNTPLPFRFPPAPGSHLHPRPAPPRPLQGPQPRWVEQGGLQKEGLGHQGPDAPKSPGQFQTGQITEAMLFFHTSAWLGPRPPSLRHKPRRRCDSGWTL